MSVVPIDWVFWCGEDGLSRRLWLGCGGILWRNFEGGTGCEILKVLGVLGVIQHVL